MKKSIIGFAAAMLLASTVAFAGSNTVTDNCCGSCIPNVETSCVCSPIESCDDLGCGACADTDDKCCAAASCPAPENEQAHCCSDQPECVCE